jgi:hypothetical protein
MRHHMGRNTRDSGETKRCDTTAQGVKACAGTGAPEAASPVINARNVSSILIMERGI